MSDSLAKTLSQVSQHKGRGRPPVHLWNPPFCGDIDIRIAADGRWYHEGRIFQRQALVELLASIMKYEDGEYFLVSPVEKVRIQVEDAPFVALRFEEVETDGIRFFEFETNVGDIVRLDAEHPLRVDVNTANGEPRPYLLVRDGLEALVHRNVFYQLVELAEVEIAATGERFYITSGGQQFDLGFVAA